MSTEQTETFDYVVVGSGAGGGPLAANLARAGMRVLVLEAGGDYDGYTYQVPAFHAMASEDPAMAWSFFVRHYASDEKSREDPKFSAEQNGVLYPRSGTLGGCTAHNAMITIYPHNHDWDAIARMTGDRTWNSSNMRRYFQRLERCEYVPRPGTLPTQRFIAALLEGLASILPASWLRFGNPSRHGFDGWLGTQLADTQLALKDWKLVRLIQGAAADTLATDLGRPLTLLEGLNSQLDPNDWRVNVSNPQGLWFTPLATSGGKRNGTREYLRAVEAAQPNNLAIRTNALATRVLLDDANAAVGVEYMSGAHLYQADPNHARNATPPVRRQVFARREVIVSGGAFNTPQLLKLSGIGPREELAQHNIPVRIDLPGVGANLQDRYEVGVVSEMREDFSLLADCAFQVPQPGGPPDTCFVQWQAGQGPYTTNGVAISIITKSRQGRPEPDLFIFGLPGYFRGYFPGYAKIIENKHNYFTWAILKAHTRNTAGSVTLRSADPRDVPNINFRYFDEGNDLAGEDLESVIDGVEFARRLLANVGDVVKSEILPGCEVKTREQIADWVRAQAWGHHACGTCRIGPAEDPMAVVDSAFRVHGAKRLRVVDASVFPHIPGFFIVTPIYMLSEKASDVILAEAGGSGRAARVVRRTRQLLNAP
jgi:choline dehydrogenase-like flavoprotein